MAERSQAPAGVALLVAAIGALVVVDARNGTLRAGLVWTTIAWFLVAFVGYLVVVRAFERQPRLASRWKWFIGLGLVLRLLLLATEPTLSDDVYRYLWEGHLVTEGVSPYAFTIDDPAGDIYDIPARSLANNTSLASPYLPAAHGIFGATALVLPSSPWSMQLLMIGFDLLAVTMISLLLGTVGLPRHRALLYWLNPLAVVEVGHGAHIDAIILGLVMFGLYASLKTSESSLAWVIAGPTAVAVATLTRPLALLLVPVLFWMWSWRQRLLWTVVLIVPIALAGSATSLGLDDSGTGVFGSARAYADSFRFNSGIYHWFESWVGGRGLDDRGWNEPMALTRLIVAAVVAALILIVFVVARRPRSNRATMRLLTLPLIVYVLLTPVLHPWYILTLIGFVPFLAPGDDEPVARWSTVVPWVLLSALLIFSYLTYEDPNAFGERDWIRRLEWLPTLAACAIAAAWAGVNLGSRGRRSVH